ncbi:MAG: hypothetical protein BGN88_04520 [Clostridiales bacterium 43-6]|nr:MAG: hypothetical protein BGN88_04520 [Clostridiales bacterium 43-6]
MKRLSVFLTFLIIIGMVLLIVFFWAHAKALLIGMLHGVISPVTLVISFFTNKVHFYSNTYTGLYHWLYDLGFFLTIAGGTGATISKTNNRP